MAFRGMDKQNYGTNRGSVLRSPGIRLLLIGLFALLLSACSGAAAEEQEPIPGALPAGQDGISQTFSDTAPPLGPSLGTNRSAIPNRLELPSIGVDTDVVKIGWQPVEQPDGTVVSTWEVASFAAGWHKNSALPGEQGNVVLSGHNNIDGAVFRKLYTMQPGDVARLYANGQAYEYQVEKVLIVEEKFAPIETRRENARWIQPFDDERLTLVSCWPEDDNTHRVIVVAKPVDQ